MKMKIRLQYIALAGQFIASDGYFAKKNKEFKYHSMHYSKCEKNVTKFKLKHGYFLSTAIINE